MFSLRLSADEKALLEATDAKAWARDVLLRSAVPFTMNPPTRVKMENW